MAGYWSREGAQSTALTFLLQRASKAGDLEVHRCLPAAVWGGRGGSCTFTVAPSGSVLPRSRCQLCLFWRFICGSQLSSPFDFPWSSNSSTTSFNWMKRNPQKQSYFLWNKLAAVVLTKLASKGPCRIGTGVAFSFPLSSSKRPPKGSYRISSLWFLGFSVTCPLRKEPFWLRSSFPFSRSGHVKMASSLSSSDSECIRLVLRTWAFCLPPLKERDSQVKTTFTTGQTPQFNSIPLLRVTFLSRQGGSLIRLPCVRHYSLKCWTQRWSDPASDTLVWQRSHRHFQIVHSTTNG